MDAVGAAATALAEGRRPSRIRSFAAAVVVGAAAATLTYRLLRRAPESPNE